MMTEAWIRETPVTTLQLGSLRPAHRGKVREMFDLGDRFLMVATDRISAFDVILPSGIPGKGKILTALSIAWFDALQAVVSHHYISKNPKDFPPEFQPFLEVLTDRALLVRRAHRFDVECVVRGYLAGSGWKEYQATGAVSGVRLPAGLKLCDRLPQPIFTPSTKAEEGHDENINFAQMESIVGADAARRLRSLSLAVYEHLADYCATRGIIVADTKFEFGAIDRRIALIDEVLTPDSSRFWPADQYAPGRNQDSFDKQYVRDYLETLNWDKTPPGPVLPREVVTATAERYLEAHRRLVDPERPLRFQGEPWS
jgi:phosphoribosylaminoimidazole-succinocarboxamide synthase